MEVRNLKPVKIFRQGSCSASVFANEVRKNGKSFPMQKVSVQKSYKDGDEWKNTSSYDINDLPKLALVASKAYEFLTCKEGAA